MRLILFTILIGMLLLAGCGPSSSPSSADAGSDGSSPIAVESSGADASAGVAGADSSLPSSSVPSTSMKKTAKTLRDAMAWGKPAHCTWDLSSTEQRSKGEMWVTKGKWKQVATAKGQSVTSLADGKFVYVWGAKDVPAMKIEMDTSSTQEKDSSAPPSRGSSFGGAPSAPDMDVEYDFDCEQMDVPASMFVPPSDIDFMSLDEMMAAMMKR